MLMMKKRDDENEQNEKQSKPRDQDLKTENKSEKQDEMSINSSIPDIENQTKESDKAEDEVEIENASKPDLKKKGKTNFGDLKYKTFTEEFDEIIKAEDLESVEELAKIKKKS